MIESVIDCIDCGGRCRLQVTWAPDDPPQPLDIVAYRCEDCRDVWYIEIPEDADE
ncbi:MAG TPA: hypothetical protein VHC63_17770 [Acidimicrobiales bacterium]|nr:hypothetical protein [Acidimicrobiales bacterium]